MLNTLRLKAGVFSFVVSSNSTLYYGASVDFLDINPLTLNLDFDLLEEKLIDAKKIEILTKILIAVHFAGLPCDMGRIARLGKKFNFRIIEDAPHGLGSRDRNYLTRSCPLSGCTIFSSHPVKIITSGEECAITTNNETLHQRCKLLRSHGITKDPDKFEDVDVGNWYYEQQLLGFNSRLTDIQAALGAPQLKWLNMYVEKRNRIASLYREKLASLDIKM